MTDRAQQTVLITGASSGIGEVTAIYLAEKGYKVIGTSRAEERLGGLRAAMSNGNLPITPLELDINSDEDVDSVLTQLLEEIGTVDVLVNNAGYGLWGPVELLSMEELRAQFETNFFAAVRLIKAVLPGMESQRSGTIINVGSVAGRLATPFNGAYSASKFALEGLSESLSHELRPMGISVAIVEPGLYSTNFQKNRVVAKGTRNSGSPYGPHIDRYNRAHRRFDRLSSDPKEIAKVIHSIIRRRHPTLRHPVGFEARMGMMGARFIPERLFQKMVRKATLG